MTCVTGNLITYCSVPIKYNETQGVTEVFSFVMSLEIDTVT